MKSFLIPLEENSKPLKMKHLLLLTIVAITFMACTKKASSPSDNTTQGVFFQNDDMVVENVVVANTANVETFSFSAAFKKNITRIELMSGKTISTFCTIQSVDLSGDVSQKKAYSFNDANAKEDMLYYMLRFRKSDGNWVYTPYIIVRF